MISPSLHPLHGFVRSARLQRPFLCDGFNPMGRSPRIIVYTSHDKLLFPNFRVGLPGLPLRL